MVDSRDGQGKHQMRLEHLTVPESKQMPEEQQNGIKRTQKITYRVFHTSQV